jgi:rhomboid protease GluP
MQVPVLTLAVLFATFAFTCAEHLHPSLLGLLRRDPVALSHHQWWRLFTPLLVQPDPWPRALMVFLLFLIVGALSERLWKRSGWITLYLLCGLTGEIAGYFWEPYNAGMSVAGAGLLGSLAAWVILSAPPWQAKLGAGFIVLGAVILICISDIHGPPILVGAFMATVMIRHGKSFLTRDRHLRHDTP